MQRAHMHAPLCELCNSVIVTLRCACNAHAVNGVSKLQETAKHEILPHCCVQFVGLSIVHLLFREFQVSTSVMHRPCADPNTRALSYSRRHVPSHGRARSLVFGSGCVDRKDCRLDYSTRIGPASFRCA